MTGRAGGLSLGDGAGGVMRETGQQREETWEEGLPLGLCLDRHT